jgi:hypothetical protein
MVPVEDIAEARLDAFERSAENGPLAPHPDHFKVREMITLIRKLRGSTPHQEPK